MTAIKAVAAVSWEAPAPADLHASPPAGDGFARLLQTGLGEVNASVRAAETAMNNLAAGKPVQLHEVMIDLEQARLSVQMFVQVRNRLVESFLDLTRMQM
ncbi:flagellar hook-basal body complex protein FliE [Povalibacter uvarum]|uniref:Flagellar hook-basal body complex protein FliE n=1 Tax=Povalibacter uvarum TaxID=732238 RepID=A0A841HFP2_9GAMM|nr:flagellar hook-basal body complex protein FliE [Povalibacter uvarum]MBB6091170.1 flagellar hook-basal body complex protein FliE [Povalibacter uvarum]